LTTTKAIDVLPNYPVVYVKSSARVPVALENLVNHEILSLPVVNESLKPIGFFDVADLVVFVLKLAEATPAKDFPALFRYEEFTNANSFTSDELVPSSPVHKSSGHS